MSVSNSQQKWLKRGVFEIQRAAAVASQHADKDYILEGDAKHVIQMLQGITCVTA